MSLVASKQKGPFGWNAFPTDDRIHKILIEFSVLRVFGVSLSNECLCGEWSGRTVSWCVTSKIDARTPLQQKASLIKIHYPFYLLDFHGQQRNTHNVSHRLHVFLFYDPLLYEKTIRAARGDHLEIKVFFVF